MSMKTFKYFEEPKYQLEYSGLVNKPVDVKNRTLVFESTFEYANDQGQDGGYYNPNRVLLSMGLAECPVFIPGADYVLTVGDKEYYTKAAVSTTLFEPNSDGLSYDNYRVCATWDDGYFIQVCVPDLSQPLPIDVKIEKADIIWGSNSGPLKLFLTSGQLHRGEHQYSDTYEYTLSCYTPILPIPRDILEISIPDHTYCLVCDHLQGTGTGTGSTVYFPGFMNVANYPGCTPPICRCTVSSYDSQSGAAEFGFEVDESVLGNLDGETITLSIYPVTKGEPMLYSAGQANGRYLSQLLQEFSEGQSITGWISGDKLRAMYPLEVSED